MNNVKTFFKERSLGFYLAIPAIIIAIITNFLYKKVGVNSFSPSLNSQVFLFSIIGIVLTVVSLGMSFVPCGYVKMLTKAVRFAAYLFLLYTFILFIYTQVNFIANVFVAIDGNTFSPTFILTLVFYVLACVLTAVSAGLDNCIPWNKKKVEEGE